MDKKINKNNRNRRPAALVRACCILIGFFLCAGCDSDSPADEKTAESVPLRSTFEGSIAAVGNSLTAGLGVAEEMTYPARLGQKLKAAGFNYQVINAGVSGETSSGALSRIEWVISSLDPDIVILETGANDGLRGIDPLLVEANLNRICSLLKKKNIQVLLTGMEMLPNLGPEYTRDFSSIFARVAKKHQVVFMPFFLKGVAGETALNQSDRIHPNGRGYAIITDNIYPHVLETIARHRGAKGGRPPPNR